jgi:5-methylcytosine-specific restriction protein B
MTKLMTVADDVRVFTYDRFIKPALEEGDATVTIRAGDVHDEMGLKGKIPSVCGALGAKKFLKQYNLSLEKREGPSCGVNVTFTYRIIEP